MCNFKTSASCYTTLDSKIIGLIFRSGRFLTKGINFLKSKRLEEPIQLYGDVLEIDRRKSLRA
jgi:hypothetical protein